MPGFPKLVSEEVVNKQNLFKFTGVPLLKLQLNTSHTKITEDLRHKTCCLGSLKLASKSTGYHLSLNLCPASIQGLLPTVWLFHIIISKHSQRSSGPPQSCQTAAKKIWDTTVKHLHAAHTSTCRAKDNTHTHTHLGPCSISLTGNVQ